MDREGVISLIKDLNGPNAATEVNGDWINSNCPLAPWTHESGKDSKPSFGVQVNEEGESRFYCFTCHSKGSIKRLLKLIAENTNDYSLYDYYEPLLKNEEFAGGPLPEWSGRKPKTKEKTTHTVKPLDEDYEDLYDPVDFVYRGISVETAQRIGLVHGEDSRGAHRIIFPVRGLNGELYGYTGRATEADVVPKVRDFHGLQKENLLLGLHTLPHDAEYVCIVEGLYDYARQLQYGEPVVSTMHANLTEQQSRILIKLGLPVVVFYDNDKAGKEGTKIAIDRLIQHVPVRRVVYPKQAPKGCDPGKLSKKHSKWLLRKARLCCVSTVKRSKKPT